MIISKCKKPMQIFPGLTSDFFSDLDSTQTWTLVTWDSKRDSKYCDLINTVSCKLLTIKHPVNNSVFVQIVLGFSVFIALDAVIFLDTQKPGYYESQRHWCSLRCPCLTLSVKPKHILTGSCSCPQVQVWDTAGQERFRKSMVEHYYRNVHAVVFVYDVTKMTSFRNLQTWIEVGNSVKQLRSLCLCRKGLMKQTFFLLSECKSVFCWPCLSAPTVFSGQQFIGNRIKIVFSISKHDWICEGWCLHSSKQRQLASWKTDQLKIKSHKNVFGQWSWVYEKYTNTKEPSLITSDIRLCIIS